MPFQRAAVQLAPIVLPISDLFATCAICTDTHPRLYKFCACANGSLCKECIRNLVVCRERDGVDFKECPFCRTRISPQWYTSSLKFDGPFEQFRATDKYKFLMKNTNWILTDGPSVVDPISNQCVHYKHPASLSDRLSFLAERIGFLDMFFTRPPLGTESVGDVRGRAYGSDFEDQSFIYDTCFKYFNSVEIPFCATPMFIFWSTHIDVYQHVTKGGDYITIEKFFINFKKNCRNIRRIIADQGLVYLSFDQYLRKQASPSFCPWSTSWNSLWNATNGTESFKVMYPIPDRCTKIPCEHCLIGSCVDEHCNDYDCDLTSEEHACKRARMV